VTAPEGRAKEAPIADLVAAGRALEAGDPVGARGMMGPSGTSPEWIYLAARVAAQMGEHDEAVRLFELMAGARADLEVDRRTALVEALAASGKHEAAAAAAAELLASEPGPRPDVRRRLAADRGRWLMRAGLVKDAVEALEEARKGSDGAERDAIDLDLALARVSAGEGSKERTEGLKALARLAESASSARVMTAAESALSEAGAPLEWKGRRRLERAARLSASRSWDQAAAMLEPLLADEKGELFEEARWERARLLFNRRRHYAEAVEVADEIIAGRGRYADEARFLRARALSRLDRDREAIKAYREIGRRAGKSTKADEARFQACRLEFYLGEHRAAMSGLERLVGDGKKRHPATALGPDTTREAHFIAGLSAILAGVPRRAGAHLAAASKGSDSGEALERNEYWAAVALVAAGDREGPARLAAICGKDPSSWYAILASARLRELGTPARECGAGIPPGADAGVENGEEAVAAGDPVKPLEELSATAAFFARIGLYRDAAAYLREAEKGGTVKASERDWIVNYLALDAPHHAVRRASRGLRWPPDGEDMWRAGAAYPRPFEDLVREEEAARALPADLIYAIARKESLFDPHAVSSVGALGMMQMMPHTYETNRVRAGLPPLREGELPGPQDSIRAAGRELEHLLGRFGGSLPLAIMAYNGGAAAVSGWLRRSGEDPTDVFVEKVGFGQTRNYVRRVYQNLARYRAMAGQAPPEIPPIAKAALETGPEEGADAGVDSGA